MASNCNKEIRKLGSVRSFIQVPDARTCGKETLYYGKNCQMMEVDAVQESYRASPTLIRTWNRYDEKYCTIGNQQSPPDDQTFTVRFYETCDVGVPLPHTLRDCRVRIINNHGLCKTQGDAAGGWSNYQEVIDGVVQSENRGRRSSYDGADDPLTDELTLQLLNIFDVSGVYFSKVAISNVCAGTPTFNNAAFDCSTGCGDNRCGCRTTCNDGTNTFYVPTGCTGNATQNYLWYTTDGGESGSTLLLPVPAAGVATADPKVAFANGRLYVMAYEAPPTLYSISLNEHGVPTGSWTEVATLGGTDGTPAVLVADGDVLHMLVNAPATGSRFYTLGDGYNPTDGARKTFTAAENIRDMDVCGEDLYAVGDAGVIEYSADGGDTWSSLASPTTQNLNRVEIVGVNIWIVGAAGQVWRSSNGGTSWTQVKVGSSTANVTDFQFNGDNVGWLINSSEAPYSTALGGELYTDWLNSSPRIVNWPTGVIAKKAIVPPCATGPSAVNTVLILGTDAAGNDVAYLGRGRTAGR